MKLPGTAPSGDAIAADALKYVGHPYVFGAWDCSGFANHVLGQDFGMTLPGGVKGFRGPPPHGPVVVDYAGWSGASTVSSPARGDLVLWPGIGANGHMGFVLGPDQMVSALDPADGTKVTPISGFGPPGVNHIFRRVNGSAAGTPGGGGSPGSAAAGGGGINQVLLAALTVAGMAVGVVALAAVAGTLVAVTGVWLASKAGG